MAEIDIVNSTFIQKGPICAMASYATVIEYFSDPILRIRDILERYIQFRKISYFKFGNKIVAKKHQAIYKDFHDYCKPDMRGFTFIEQLHRNDSLRTAKYCDIVISNALKQKVTDGEIERIRTELVENGAIAIVLYKVNQTTSHAVTIGYDENIRLYFLKDPEKATVERKDILAEKEICEYIVFND